MSFSVTNFGKRVDIIFIIKVGITREKCQQLFGGNESCSLFRIILLTIITFLLQKNSSFKFLPDPNPCDRADINIFFLICNI